MRVLKTAALALLLIGSPVGLVAQSAAPTAISASDKAQGAQAHPQLLEQFGGPYAGRQADYVRRVGQKIAIQSGLSNAQSDFTVTLLDSPVNNAFAIQGGYVYVTRQLLALMNDEAELAFVMGHEVGHVAARHPKQRNDRTTIATVLSGIVGAVAGNSGLGSLIGRGASTLAQGVLLKFSRTQEYEADDLGVRYLGSAGYDPLASADMLAALADQTELDSRASGVSRSVPEWASTHPDPGARVARAAAAARAGGRAGGLRNRDVFLAAIDGMLYGDDPKQGIVDGQDFRFPAGRWAFTAPAGFTIANGARAVTLAGEGGQAQLTTGALGGSLDAYVDRVFKGIGGGQAPEVQARRVSVAGLAAATATVRANTQNGPVDVTVFAYALDTQTAAHFIAITAAGSGEGPFAPLFASFRRMTPAEAASVRARRVSVVAVRPGDTVASLAARMAYPDLRVERFSVLNALRPDSVLRPGQKVKLIVLG